MRPRINGPLTPYRVGPLTPYKPPFNPINRPWDLSRSIELEEIYILVDLELHRTYLGPRVGLHGPMGPYGPMGPMDPGPYGPGWPGNPGGAHGPMGQATVDGKN